LDIRVSGHQVDTGEALRTHVSERINAITDKYFSKAVAANVTFGRGPYDDFTCDIVSPVSQGVVLKASNRANDAHVAFEGAADKIEKQLRRYVKRLRERRSQAAPDHSPEMPAEVQANAGYTIFAEASVGDAAMMLDLRNTNALMFKNAKTGDFNMIYRRDDGTIGWVEPGGA